MIRVCEPLLAGNEMRYVADCVESNWISSHGDYVDRFERGFAQYCGCEFGVSTTNGTTALHLAVAALGIGPSDEVILPAFTMISSAFAVAYTGATPVLVDADPRTWTMDVSMIEESITSKTKAIMVVHIYGHPCNMDPILAIAKEYSLFVIEDAAEAHGAEYKSKKVGGLGHIGCFSFYANKIITTGEGGMVVTNDDQLAANARRLKDLGFLPERRFLHRGIGFNYRMTNIQAAIGLAQFERIDYLLEKRRSNARHYGQLLQGISAIGLPCEESWARNVYWMYGITIEACSPMGTGELMEELRCRGIETRAFFVPMHQQPCFLNMGLFEGEHYPTAEELSRKGLYLPSGPTLTEDQIRSVCDAVIDVVSHNRSDIHR